MPRAKYHYLQKYALNMLTAAIQRGDLVPAEHCQKCGCPSEGRALDGHHEDYSKPLEVEWLCCSCHKKHHREHEYRAGREGGSPKLEKL